MGMIAAAVKDTTVTQKREPPGTMHLWFLYYLMAFSALGAMLYNVKWLRLDKLFHYPVLWILGPMVLVPGAFAGGTPLAAPESFMPHWWPFAFYVVFYFGGWCLYGKERLLESWCPYAWYLVMLCVVLYVPYYMWMPVLELKDIVAGIPSQPFWLRCVEALFTAYLSTFLTLAALLLGKRYLSRKSGLLSFLADSSYWVYLLHLPIVLFLQTLLVPLAIPVWIKFAIVLAGTLISCFVTYVVFVRYTPVGWLLHGKRTFP
jgi:peptidoglycan/LPS O-acetylase OafA/YrhL